jgi:hypothetical protein
MGYSIEEAYKRGKEKAGLGGESGSKLRFTAQDALERGRAKAQSSQLGLSDDAKKYISEQFKSSWNYDLLDPEDLRRKAGGLMPRAVESKYGNSDAYLKTNNLPAYGDLEKYVEDYNAYADRQNTYNGFTTELYGKFAGAAEDEYENIVAT